MVEIREQSTQLLPGAGFAEGVAVGRLSQREPFRDPGAEQRVDVALLAERAAAARRIVHEATGNTMSATWSSSPGHWGLGENIVQASSILTSSTSTNRLSGRDTARY
jgi:hypothetical protein